MTVYSAIGKAAAAALSSKKSARGSRTSRYGSKGGSSGSQNQPKKQKASFWGTKVEREVSTPRQSKGSTRATESTTSSGSTRPSTEVIGATVTPTPAVGSQAAPPPDPAMQYALLQEQNALNESKARIGQELATLNANNVVRTFQQTEDFQAEKKATAADAAGRGIASSPAYFELQDRLRRNQERRASAAAVEYNNAKVSLEQQLAAIGRAATTNSMQILTQGASRAGQARVGEVG